MGSILNYEDEDQLDSLMDNKFSNMPFAKNAIRKLKRTIFDKKLINFFLEPQQDIDKALNIFIRINSGGEPLSFSDLIMSIAVSNWKTLNARDEIHHLVDTIRGIGFNISKDLVLKSFLYLYSNNIKFMVKNFSIDNAQQFEDQWVNIKECLIETFNLIKILGFNDITLTSKNSILPIFYWLYHLKIYKDFSTKIQYKDQRNQIKEWLHIALIKQIFSGTSDNVLTQIREALTSDYTLIETEFPKNILFNKIKKNLSVGTDFISDLLNTQYEDKRAFSILALLYPYLDYKNNNFHKDHLHPKTSFSELKNSSYTWKEYNSIVNLQMLDSNENMSKNDISLEKWCNNHHDIPTFKKQFLIPENESLELSNFDQFYIARKNILLNKLLAILEVPQVLNQIEVPQTCNQSFIPEYHSFTVYNESEQENILLEIDFQNHINSVPSKYISHDNLLKLKMLHENQQLQYLSFDEHPKKIQKIIPVTQKIWKLQVVDLTSIDNIDNNWETCDLNNL